ncbi:MAG TPA: AAA family ATPase, partial [Polyangiales bacterium]|nr:AAA family ATPase [Polyangiales bacterium]
EAHRSMLRLLLQQGRRAAALQHYRTLVRMLREELDAEPDRLTQQLHAEIERASSPPAAAATAVPVVSVSQPMAAVTTGRARELAQLLAGLAPSCLPPVSLLVGEAGVGKTHLCDRVAHEAELRGYRVLRARCFESEQVLPLAPWANLLRSAVGPETQLPREHRAELATLIPQLAPDEPARATDARRLFLAVHELVTSLATPAPLLILLEDVHWADEMSARLLSYLGRQQRQRPSVFLVTARDEDVAATSFIRAALGELEREQLLSRVHLAPLSADDTRELAAKLAEEHALPALEPGLLDQIWTISEGNALVIVESVRALACGSLARDVTQLPVPERVRSLILSRVAKVSPAARELLAVAAVAGRELDLHVLLAALQAVPLWAALDELAQAQLVRAAEERVYFTHDRIRETLYREMLPVRRRFLHGCVARALEQHAATGPHATLGHIGYHYSKAGDAPAAVRYLLRFAATAWRDHGVQEALVALEQAYADSAQLPQPERDNAAIEIVIRQAYCLSSLGRFVELVGRLQAVAPQIEALQAPELVGPYHFFCGLALAMMAERRQADTHAQRALAAAVSCGDTRVMGYTHALLSYLCQMTGRFHSGVQHGVRATELLARCDDTPEAAVIAWLSLGLNQMWLGDPQAALQASDKAAELAHVADNLRGQALAATAAGCVYAYTDQWERALEATHRGIEASKDPFTLVSAVWMAAWAHAGSGQTEQAIALLTEVVSQLAQHGMRAWSGHALTILADAQLRAGDAARAVQLALEALEVAGATHDRACVGWALRVSGQAALSLGDLAAARERIDRSVCLFEELEARIDLAKSLVERSAVSSAEARWEQARRDLQRARELFTTCGVHASLRRVAELEASLLTRVDAVAYSQSDSG